MQAYHEIVITPENIPAIILLHTSKSVNQPHWHESVELLASLNSQLHISCGQNTFDLMENDVAVINDSQIHCVSALKGHSFTSLSLRISPEVFQKYCGKGHCWFDLNRNPEVRREIASCCHKLYEFYSEEDIQPYLLLEANSILFHIVYLMVTYVRSDFPTDTLQYSEKYYKRYREIMRYMEEHYNEPISLEDIASFIHLSKEHLSREFSTYVGEGFREHLTNIRLNNAHKDLLGSDLPLIDVAIKNGFSDLRCYNRAFQKYYKTTPAQYRRKHKRIKNERTTNL